MDEPTPRPDEAERELAARRRALEQEFEDKARELKAQHKRVLDRLQQDREDWERHRREQAKELADRVERVRRHDGNEHAKAEAKAASREELDALRADVEAQRTAKLEAKDEARRLHERLAGADGRLAAARRRVAWAVGIAVALALAAVLLDLRDPSGPALIVAGLLGLVAVGLVMVRIGLRSPA